MPAAAATRIFGAPAMTWAIAAGRASCAAARSRGPCKARHPAGGSPARPRVPFPRVVVWRGTRPLAQNAEHVQN